MRQWICSAGYWALCCVVALGVFTMFLRSGGIDIPRATVPDMVYGRAHRPFVQRALVPMVVRFAGAVSPASVQRLAEDKARNSRGVRAVFVTGEWDQTYAFEYMLTCLIIFASLLGFLWAVQALASDLYGAHPIATRLAGMVALVFLPAFFSKDYYSAIYDFPTLLLFTLGLLLLLREKWIGFLIVFVLACVNKETAILLTLVFVIRYGHDIMQGEHNSRFRKLLACQMAAAVLIRGAIVFVFMNNPGSSVEFHLRENIDFYTRGYSLVTVVSLAALALAVTRNWHNKPVFLRQAAWVALPLLSVMPFFGWRYEFRACYEAYPVVLLLALPVLLEALGRPILHSRACEGCLRRGRERCEVDQAQ